jgi:hypothetical protein
LPEERITLPWTTALLIICSRRSSFEFMTEPYNAELISIPLLHGCPTS